MKFVLSRVVHNPESAAWTRRLSEIYTVLNGPN